MSRKEKLIEIKGITYKKIPCKTNDKVCKDCDYFWNNGTCNLEECPCSTDEILKELKRKKIMIKRIDENHIEIDGFIYEKREKQKNILPDAWEEFCQNYPIKKGEAYINDYSNLVVIGESKNRQASIHRNLLPSKELAKAISALCQLIQLRDCYNEDWKPNWDDGFEQKYGIYNYRNKIDLDVCTHDNEILVFKTIELRNKFYNNFKDLIEIAKPLL